LTGPLAENNPGIDQVETAWADWLYGKNNENKPEKELCDD